MQPIQLDLITQNSSTDELALIKVEGKLSLETVNNFLQAIRMVSAQELILDMSGVKFIDSAGVGAMVQLYVHCRNKSQKFVLAALSPQGHTAMEVADLLKRLPAYPSVTEALNHKA